MSRFNIPYADHQEIVLIKNKAIHKALTLLDDNSVFSEMLKHAIENHPKEHKILGELTLAIETLKIASTKNHSSDLI